MTEEKDKSQVEKNISKTFSYETPLRDSIDYDRLNGEKPDNKEVEDN